MWEVGTTTTYFRDTLTSKNYIGYDSIVDFIPEKVIIDKSDPGFWQYSVTNSKYFSSTNRLIKTKMAGLYSTPPHDCVFVIWSKGNKDLGNDKKYFIEGLGSYYFYTQVSDHTALNELVYYNKGGEEWGTPYTFNCDDFITSSRSKSNFYERSNHCTQPHEPVDQNKN
ncbi:MAG: hypothetical protein R2764_00605 [Bacteroidales bacterium]